jgi:iron complex outermembrane receptor protein
MTHFDEKRGGLRLARAISVALGFATAASGWAQTTATPPVGNAGPPAAGNADIEEIVVTATRRTENLQNVPIAITVLTGTALQQLNVQTLDDYVKYLPSVTITGFGPGQNEIYMRGLSTSHDGAQVSGGYAQFPNVAVYLDDQSVQLPGRNLDVYAADMERIEVLEGPQGTLYGAGAQAGAIRYITNKPKLDVTEGGTTASYSTTAHGDPSTAAQAFINLPLIADTLAFRAVIYNDRRGGYINNVPGTFARQPTDGGIVSYFGGVVPANSQTLSNANLVGNAINPVTYTGVRGSLYYKINDDWNALLEQSYQQMEADGVFAYNPALGDLNVQQYNPSVDKDKFEDTAWTVNGRAGPVKLVYTGGYLVRNVDAVADYTAYSRGAYAAYYQCNGPKFTPGTAPVCYSPSATWHNVERNTHQSHELRASTPDNSRVRGLLGVFWEDYKIEASQNFAYGQEQAGFAPFGPIGGIPVFDPGNRPAGTVFIADLTRGYRQGAVFGEIAFDILPTLTLTVGSRYYHFNNYLQGQSDSEFGCRNINPCAPPSGGFTIYNEAQVNTGHKDKVNISWKPLDGVLLYATYSEGFRPGGFNRGNGILSPNSPLYGKFTIPDFYDSDNLKNYEIGWKTQWFDHRLQFNGAIYQENWSNVQLGIYDPSLYGNSEFIVNGPNYRVRGVEPDLVWRATDQLTLNASAAWNSSSQLNEPSLVSGTGAVISLFPTNGPGSSLANAPPFQGNLRARYEYPVADYHWYVQAAAAHTGHSIANVITQGAFGSPDYNLAGYTTYDAALGANRGAWEVEAYVQNLTDTRAEVFISSTSAVKLTTTNRPRTAGLRFSYKFSVPD